MSVALSGHGIITTASVSSNPVQENLLSPIAWDAFCTGLLLLGLYHSASVNGFENRSDVGVFIQFLAALCMIIPHTIRVFWNEADNLADTFSDQLVLLAIFGAMASGEYTTAVLVPAVMNLGHWFEKQSIQGTQETIRGLQRLHARSATLLDNEQERIVDPRELVVGQTLLVRPGEIIAADGRIHSGHSTLDESMITGESLPREVKCGEDVFAGAINLSGTLQVLIEKVGEATSLGRISTMLDTAAQSKAPIVKSLERYAEFYVPVVLLVAAAVMYQTRDLQRVIVIMIVSCPCALVLSGPAAMIAALAHATRRGILIKNTKFLEALADSDTIVFDKTGTLTHGQLEVVGVHPQDDTTSSELMEVAILCAHHSRHPVSAAIARQANNERGVFNLSGIKVHELPGQGIEIRSETITHRLGKPAWFAEQGFTLPEIPEQDGPVVCVASDTRFLGFILLADRLRDEATAVVNDLRQQGMERVVMLTGDRKSTAEAIAQPLGLDQVIADALPQDKFLAIQAENRARRKVIVVGDGINDALALAAGNVGIAMGARGSDIAIQSADIALMNNDLSRLCEAVRLSRATRKTINRNVIIAVSSTVVMLVAGSLGILSPLVGAVVHNLGTVLVLLHSALLLRGKE